MDKIINLIHHQLLYRLITVRLYGIQQLVITVPVQEPKLLQLLFMMLKGVIQVVFLGLKIVVPMLLRIMFYVVVMDK